MSAWRWIALFVFVVAVVVFGFSLIDSSSGGTVAANAVLLDVSGGVAGYPRADAPRRWQFPRDFGAHPEYQTEWWYYTGNLTDDSGRRFGYQFTIFRRALTPPDTLPASASEWRTNQVYLVHFTVSDLAAGRFYHDERLARASADLAGALPVVLDAAPAGADHPDADAPYRVWVESWQVAALDPDAQTVRISADAGAFALDVTVTQTKPPALHGANTDGLSAKSGDAGNASYYYSLTRGETAGTIRIRGDTFSVTGLTWKDHEFSTSALAGNAQGWDWFGLILDDGRELMLGQIRHRDGGREPAFGGLLVAPDGTTTYLASNSFTITATDTWTSPHTGAVYPSGWTLAVAPPDAEPFTLTLTPLLADQELQTGVTSYWEGAVAVSGAAGGYGYAELTGYVEAMAGRF